MSRLGNGLERAAALAGLVVFAPVLALAAAAVLVEDGAPVLFRQRRIGRGNRPFLLLKFRSMRNGQKGTAITAGGDPRVTRAGSLLRRYKLDELPQLWNVVRGEMSLVGPRPEIPSYVDYDNPVWRQVLGVRPGITDLATLVYREEEEILSRVADPERHYREVLLPAKLALNRYYLASRSPGRDLKLILLTLRYSFLPAGFDAARIERAFTWKNS